METPVLSIVVPIYNAEQFIHKCVESILKQTFQNFELILVNDGSPDRCGEICDEYASRDHRVKVVHKENEGVSAARNTGIEVSIGKCIMFADADDYVENTWCEEMYKVIAKNNESLIVSGYYLHINRGRNHQRETVNINDMEAEVLLRKEDFFQLYSKNLFNTQWNKIFIAKVIKDNEIRFHADLSIGEDLLFNLNYLEKVNGIVVVNKPLYNYILRETESLESKYYEDLFDINRTQFNEVHKCMQLFEVDLEGNKSIFYTRYFNSLLSVLDNTFMEQSKLSFLEKVKHNTMILRSNEFKECLREANLSEWNKIYVRLLKWEYYFFVFIFKKLSDLKNKALALF